MIRKALEPLAFQRRQPSDEQRPVSSSLLQNKVGGIFMLTGTLGGGRRFTISEYVYPAPYEPRR